MAAGGAWETRSRRPRRWPVLLLAVLAAPALVVFARGGVISGEDGGIPVETAAADPPMPQAPPAEPTPGGSSPPPAPVAGGDWELLGDAPVSVPAEHRAVWTGEELVVFGEGEAASYHVESRRWSVLPDAPVRQAPTPAPLWTGSAVLVWGAPTSRSPGRLAVAAYDPLAGRWREGATGPLPALATGVAVWTGREALVWGALSSGSKVAAAYDPAANTWSRVPQAPVPPAEGAGGLWTGRELVVWGERVGFRNAPFAAAYDPLAGRWRRLPPPPLDRPSGAAAAWTGSDLVLWGTPERREAGRGAGGGEPAGAALRVDDDGARWRQMWPAPSGSVRGHGQVQASAAWTGEHVALAGTLSGLDGWLYRPASGAWHVLPDGGGRRLRPAMAWTGQELLVWGGYTTGGPVVDLVAWRPGRVADRASCDGDAVATAPGGETGALPPGWERSPPAPLDRVPAEWTAVAAGDELVLFPGVRASEHALLPAVAFDLAERRWRCLPEAPLAGRSRAAAVWTGEEVLVWGGLRSATAAPGERGRLGDGAAYHPATGSWRRLPPAPVGSGSPYAAAWTGREMLVWGLPAPPGEPGAAAGAAYDPAANRWRRIADAPVELARGGGAWTGDELVVAGRSAGGEDPPGHATAAAYDPAADSWRRLEGWPLSPLASTVASAPGLLVAWDYLLDAAVHDPATGAWESLPEPPMQEQECQPESTAVGSEHVLAWHCDQAAVLDIGARRWRPVGVPEPLRRQGMASAAAVTALGAAHVLAPDGAVFSYRP